VTFTVTVAPSITSLSPTSGAIGTAVTITGTNFGATQGTSTVRFNGTTATPTTWSNTSIVAPVPSGATTGSVVVTANSLPSNGVTFTVTTPPTLTLGPSAVAPSGTVTVSWSNIPTPTTADWIVLVPVANADQNWFAWVPATGASSGNQTMTLPSYAPTGPYNARYFANNTYNRVSVSNTISVQPPTLVASPMTVAPGGTLTLTWQNIGQPSTQDWLSLNPVTAADANWLASIYATGRANDSVTFPIPSTLPAGTYNVRLYSNGTFDRLAISNSVTVTAAGPTLAVSPVLTAPGATLTVNWQNIAAPTPNDWVGVYPVGAADANYAARIFSSGRATDRALMQLPGTLTAGTYELRLFSNNTFTRLASSNTFNLGGPRLSVSSASVEPNGTLTVTWSGIPSPTPKDWYALIRPNDLDSNWVASGYTTGTANGSNTLTIPMAFVPLGTYELRLFSNDGWQRIAVSNLVKVEPKVTVSPTAVVPGETVTVSWKGIPTPTTTDWFSLNPLNNNDHNWLGSLVADGRSSDSVTYKLPTNLPAGAYDLRLYANNGWNRYSLSNVITVTASGPTVTATPIFIANGTTLTVNWNGIASPSVNNWIGLYAVGAPDANFLGQVFTNGQATGSGSMTHPALAAGAYELRLFADSAFTRLAVSNGITAVAGAAVQASPGTVAKGGTLVVTWQGIANPTPNDWFALGLVGTADAVRVLDIYTTGAASGSINVIVPASIASGNYELRLFSNNSLTKLGVSNVVIVP
jgi:IPT/TIG domain-containing protein